MLEHNHIARHAGRYLDLAKHLAGWSKDRSVGVAAVIVGSSGEVRSFGYNGFPRGVNDDLDERHERPAKYLWTEHAERNAIYNAARVGTPIDGCTMYLPWFPCCGCARAIAQSGIRYLVCARPDLTDPRWGKEFEVSLEILTEAGVCIVPFTEPTTTE